MLSVTDINHFYYMRDFTDMRCKYSRALSIIREQLHSEPNESDVFIVMSRNRCIVRMFAYDNRWNRSYHFLLRQAAKSILAKPKEVNLLGSFGLTKWFL